ncbi:MAG: hypothetical protein HZC28_07975 [Spirochaetes bacterium]|nr:hypothetical protein [Spirochaetota bacterium]
MNKLLSIFILACVTLSLADASFLRKKFQEANPLNNPSDKKSTQYQGFETTNNVQSVIVLNESELQAGTTSTVRLRTVGWKPKQYMVSQSAAFTGVTWKDMPASREFDLTLTGAAGLVPVYSKLSLYDNTTVLFTNTVMYNELSLSNVAPGGSGYTSNFAYPAIYSSKLYFQGHDGTYRRLYSLDTSEALSSIAPETIFGAENMFIHSGIMYFHRFDSGGNGNAFYYNGGTTAQIPRVGGVYHDYSSGFTNALSLGSTLIFKGKTGSSVDALLSYASGGNLYGPPTAGGSDYDHGCDQPIAAADGTNVYYRGYTSGAVPKIYYAYEFGYGGTLQMTSDGASHPYVTGYDAPIRLNNLVLFKGKGSDNIERIYGASNNVVYEPQEATGGAPTYESNFANPIAFNGMIYFQGYSGATRYIYAASIQSGLPGISCAVGSGSDYSSGFTCPIVSGSYLYFEATSLMAGAKIYRISTADAITSISKGTSDFSNGFSNQIVYNSRIYFSGLSTNSVRKIYVLDNSTVANVIAAASDYSNSFNNPAVYNGRLYFQGVSTNNIQKIYSFIR